MSKGNGNAGDVRLGHEVAEAAAKALETVGVFFKSYRFRGEHGAAVKELTEQCEYSAYRLRRALTPAATSKKPAAVTRGKKAAGPAAGAPAQDPLI